MKLHNASGPYRWRARDINLVTDVTNSIIDLAEIEIESSNVYSSWFSCIIMLSDICDKVSLITSSKIGANDIRNMLFYNDIIKKSIIDLYNNAGWYGVNLTSNFSTGLDSSMYIRLHMRRDDSILQN